MYDVTRGETFSDLESIWMKEVDIYSNVEAAVKMVVANKVDLVRHGCSCSSAASVLLSIRISAQNMLCTRNCGCYRSGSCCARQWLLTYVGAVRCLPELPSHSKLLDLRCFAAATSRPTASA